MSEWAEKIDFTIFIYVFCFLPFGIIILLEFSIASWSWNFKWRLNLCFRYVTAHNDTISNWIHKKKLFFFLMKLQFVCCCMRFKINEIGTYLQQNITFIISVRFEFDLWFVFRFQFFHRTPTFMPFNHRSPFVLVAGGYSCKLQFYRFVDYNWKILCLEHSINLQYFCRSVAVFELY